MMIKMIYCLSCNNLQNFDGIDKKYFLNCIVHMRYTRGVQFLFFPGSNQNSGGFKDTSTVFDVVVFRLICHESEIRFLLCVYDASYEKFDLLWYSFVKFSSHWESIGANWLSIEFASEFAICCKFLRKFVDVFYMQLFSLWGGWIINKYKINILISSGNSQPCLLFGAL